eukprot:gene31120-38457_t
MKREDTLKIIARIAACALLLGAAPARAEIVIGAVLSLTGPAASLGIPEKNTVELMPKTIGGETVRYVVLDDASDPSAAVRAGRKLVDEHHVDVIIGPSITPTSLALLEVLGPSKTPGISLAGSSVIASPVEGNKRWSFKLAPEESMQAARVFQHLANTGIKSVAFIGFNDSFGDSFIGAYKKVAAAQNVPVLADERYSKTDTSVTAQALKILAANPGAVIIGAAGTPGVTAAQLLAHGGPDRQIARMQARHVLAGRMRSANLANDLLQRQRRRVDDAGPGRAMRQHALRHQRARVQAHRAGGNQVAPAQGQQVGGAGAGANEVNSHGEVFSGVKVEVAMAA